ncbi:MAG: DEAD/DEAH box helicase [Planctomycetota bacterium]
MHRYSSERSPDLVRRAVPYQRRITDIEWWDDEEALHARVKGSAPQAYSVFLELHGQKLVASCSCPHHQGTGLDCKHCVAVALELLDRFDNIGESGGRTRRQVERPWEVLRRDLDALESDTAEERIAWRIGWIHGEFSIEPFEQKVLKSGAWSRGRKMSWGRYTNRNELWVWPMDHQIAALVPTPGGTSRFSYYYSSSRRDPPDSRLALTHLVGHPNVYWDHDPDRKIRVERSSAVLQLEPVPGDEVRIQLSAQGLDDWGSAAFPLVSGVAVIDDANSRVVILNCSQSEQLLIEHGGSVEVPANEAQGLLQSIRSQPGSSELQIDSAISGSEQKADSRIHVLVDLDREGLLLKFRVRPIPEAEFELPGRGKQEYVASSSDEFVWVARDHEAERSQLQDLLDQLEFESSLMNEDGSFRVLEGDDCLDAITVLQDLDDSDRGFVHWYADTKMSVAKVSASSSALQAGIRARKDWFSVEGEVKVEGETVQLSDLLEQIRKGKRYVRVSSDTWAKISDELRDRLGLLSLVSRDERGNLDVDRSALAVVEDAFDGVKSWNPTAEWKKLRARFEKASTARPRLPSSLKADLRDYQREGFRWLMRMSEWGVGACLADDMGLGKTVQTLAVLLKRKSMGPTLVVAPTSVGFNWISECERFAPSLRPILYRDAGREELIADLKGGDLVVTSYGLARRDEKVLSEVSWGTIVFDESQNIKNAQTKTSRALQKFKADWRLALTGTPIENHLGELWSLFRVLAPGFLGSWEHFRDRFAKPIESGDGDRKVSLAKLLRPLILRRTKGEVLKELPPRSETILKVQLSAEELALYHHTREAAVDSLNADSGDEDVDPNDQRFQVLAAITRLRQLACNARLIFPDVKFASSKLEAFLRTVESLVAGGHRALVFSQFVSHLSLVREELDKARISYSYLDGRTPAAKRKTLVENFQSGTDSLFLISLKAGGSGLNLTAADYVIHLDPWWNPAVEDQATDRAHRIGQTKPVTVYRLVSEGTIEEKILELHEQKRELVEGVLQGTGGASTLSVDELRQLLRGAT